LGLLHDTNLLEYALELDAGMLGLRIVFLLDVAAAATLESANAQVMSLVLMISQLTGGLAGQVPESDVE
jgi:hypothetical protein